MFKRLLTGILIIGLIVGFTCLRMVHVAFFDAFVLILMIIAGVEMINARKKQGKTLFDKLILLYPVPVFVGYVFSGSVINAIFIQFLTLIVLFICCAGIEIIIYAVGRKAGAAPVETKDLLSITKDTMGVILYPLTIISFMFMINHFGYNIGYVLIILTFAVSIATDTFAYIFGMLFGKNKARFAPEISPKKSVVGAVAGLIGGLVVGIVAWVLFYHLDLLNAGLTSMLTITNSVALFSMIGIVGSLATQFGDLVASAVKRKSDLKDYGKLLPGHGGILDRIDGQMFCAVVVATMFAVFMI